MAPALDRGAEPAHPPVARLLRLELFTHPDNTASDAIALRAGFELEGLRRAWDTDRDGNPEDGPVYVRLAPAIA